MDMPYVTESDLIDQIYMAAMVPGRNMKLVALTFADELLALQGRKRFHDVHRQVREDPSNRQTILYMAIRGTFGRLWHKGKSMPIGKTYRQWLDARIETEWEAICHDS